MAQKIVLSEYLNGSLEAAVHAHTPKKIRQDDAKRDAIRLYFFKHGWHLLE